MYAGSSEPGKPSHRGAQTRWIGLAFRSPAITWSESTICWHVETCVAGNDSRFRVPSPSFLSNRRRPVLSNPKARLLQRPSLELMEDGPPRCARIHHRGCWVCQKAKRLTAEQAQLRRNSAIRRHRKSEEWFECWLIFEILSVVLEIIFSAF